MDQDRPLVAIVDDDPRLRESLEELLDSAGYAACGFASAEALLARGLAGVDMLISDIGMPGIDGFELRERARAHDPGLPVLLITGRHEIADQARARGPGAFFRKPFDPAALLAAVAAALGNRNREVGREP